MYESVFHAGLYSYISIETFMKNRLIHMNKDLQQKAGLICMNLLIYLFYVNRFIYLFFGFNLGQVYE